METISADELNVLLTDPALFPANIRAASRAIHIAQYPGGDRLRKRFVEESGVYWLLMWPALSMNTYGIVRHKQGLSSPWRTFTTYVSCAYHPLGRLPKSAQ